jgi:hypothetical protein
VSDQDAGRVEAALHELGCRDRSSTLDVRDRENDGGRERRG